MRRTLLFGAAFVAAHVAAAFAGGSWWGLHHFRYLDATRLAFVVLAGASVAALLAVSPERRPRLSPALRDALIILGCFAAFWALRDRSHLLGDGSVILEGPADAPTWSDKEPLSHVVDFELHHLARRLDVADARVFELWSCLWGAVLVALLLRADRGSVLFLALTTGAVQLFCGYVEHYPLVAVVSVAFLFALRRPTESTATLFPALLLFVLALFLHVSSILLVPALAWTILTQMRLRPPARRAIPVLEIAVTAALALLAWSVVFRNVSGARSLGAYLSILGEAHRFAAAPAKHARDFVNLQLLLVPVALPLALLGMWRVGAKGVAARPWGVAVALAATCFLGAQLLFSSDLGAPRDWDVLAVGAFPIALLAASLAPPTTPRVQTALVGGLAALHTLAWVLVNATPSAALARFEELPLPGGQVEFVLGTRALKLGDAEAAEQHFENVVREVPTSCPGWFSLGLAREARGDYATARDAFAHAFAAWERDRRVAKGEILERWGRAAWQLGRAAEARQAFELAHAERPRSLPPILFLAVVAIREHRPADALHLLEPVLDRRAEQPALLMLTADALDASGRSAEAHARRAEAARLFPDDPAVKAALERRPVEEKP